MAGAEPAIEFVSAWACRALLPNSSNEFFDVRKDVADYNGNAFRCRMKIIRQIQRSDSSHVLKKERVEERSVLFGDIRIHAPESIVKILPPIARRFHPRDQEFDVPIFQRLYDFIERRLGDLGIDTAQGVICSKFHDGAVDLFIQAPIQAFKTFRCRVAGDTRIYDADVIPLVPQGQLQLRGE